MAAPASTNTTSTFEIAPKNDFTPLEANYYTLTLLDYKVRDKDPDKYHAAAWRDVEFDWDVSVPADVRERLELGDGQVKRKSWAAIPKTFTDKATLIQIGIALGKLDLTGGSADGAKVDLNDWLGAKCRGNIVEKTKADGTITDTIDGYTAFKRPAGQQAARPAPKPAPPPVDDPDGDVPF